MARIELPSYSIGGDDEHSVENQAAIKANEDFNKKCKEVAASLTDDPLLQDVYSSHLWFICNDDWKLEEPRIHEGVAFYQVGRNSSHEFYKGVKDGKRYRGSCGDTYVGPGDDCECISKAMEAFDKWKAEGGEDNYYACAEASIIDSDCWLNHYDVVFHSTELSPDSNYGYMGHS
jgi:hypothetical protein